MRIFFVFALVLALLVTVFAVQNNQPITISFLFWSIEGSLALLLMVTLVLGIVIGVLLMAQGSVRSRLQVGGCSAPFVPLSRRKNQSRPDHRNRTRSRRQPNPPKKSSQL